MRKILAFLLTLIITITSVDLYSADICVVTLVHGDEYTEVVKEGIKNKEEYCKKHGYDFVCGTEHLDPTRSIAWSKIKLVEKCLQNKSYKWVFWTDADSLIMNHGIKLEDLIIDGRDFILSTVHMKQSKKHILNTGEFLIRNSNWSKKFLKTIYNRDSPLDHPWWEQKAIIDEYTENKDVQKHFYVYPPRILNSTVLNINYEKNPLNVYKEGDFIIHFYQPADKSRLKSLIEKYSKMVVDEPTAINLNSYLEMHGFNLIPKHGKNLGYCTLAQRKQFAKVLNSYSNIKSVLEIGLNGGHSAQTILEHFPDCIFYSFDIIQMTYTNVAVEYFKRKYRNQFVFIEGNSEQTISKFYKKNPGLKVDFIYIDGSHEYKTVVQDIENCRYLAHSSTKVWIDDYNLKDVKDAVDEAVAENKLIILKEHTSIDSNFGPHTGVRVWIEAKYVN